MNLNSFVDNRINAEIRKRRLGLDKKYYRDIAERMAYTIYNLPDDDAEGLKEIQAYAESFIQAERMLRGTDKALPSCEFPYKDEGTGEPLGIFEGLGINNE